MSKQIPSRHPRSSASTILMEAPLPTVPSIGRLAHPLTRSLYIQAQALQVEQRQEPPRQSLFAQRRRRPRRAARQLLGHIPHLPAALYHLVAPPRSRPRPPRPLAQHLVQAPPAPLRQHVQREHAGRKRQRPLLAQLCSLPAFPNPKGRLHRAVREALPRL